MARQLSAPHSCDSRARVRTAAAECAEPACAHREAHRPHQRCGIRAHLTGIFQQRREEIGRGVDRTCTSAANSSPPVASAACLAGAAPSILSVIVGELSLALPAWRLTGHHVIRTLLQAVRVSVRCRRGQGRPQVMALGRMPLSRVTTVTWCGATACCRCAASRSRRRCSAGAGVRARRAGPEQAAPEVSPSPISANACTSRRRPL